MKLSDHSEAILEMLTERGIVGNPKIKDDKIRNALKIKKQNMLHNTKALLQHYRDITWVLECLPANIAEELDSPLQDLDALLSHVSNQIDLDNKQLENRMISIQRSRILLDRLNEALTILKKKPNNGKLMYDIIYHTYITSEKLSHNDLIFRLNISTRHYYRMRQQAINVLSIRLWAAPTSELQSWLEVMSILEGI